MELLCLISFTLVLSDSYEEDIAETESEGEESTDYDTDDDVAEFIDHDIDMFPPSPVPNSGGILTFSKW